ncbi:MAG: orotidine 5'-phosphate decarboxylase [Candidatus Bathyarchaeota archaeon]|nr:MAG: orotidine 5'-phosphate decarboxylase [Candidatus Bathyarchaeota archaeon]
MRTFVERFENRLKEKNSILCVGLDPALPEQRDQNTIPVQYVDKGCDSDLRLNFCLDLLDLVADFCVAAKPNEQYLRGFTSKQHQKLADSIRDHGLISIYDCKLGDIGGSVKSALFHYHKWGYDAITLNPLPGNLQQVTEAAHNYQPQIGIIALALMSNPEAKKFFITAKINRMSLYQKIAEDVGTFNADGCVVGVANHITENHIRRIRKIIGADKLLLIPGVGVQGGDPLKAINGGGQNIVINVGRDLIYSNNPRSTAEKYCSMFNASRTIKGSA